MTFLHPLTPACPSDSLCFALQGAEAPPESEDEWPPSPPAAGATESTTHGPDVVTWWG